jgi:glutathione S-transferase
MIQFSCLTDIPDMTKGLVRELRVRWMLEELGLPHEAVVYPYPETKKQPYLSLQPFGQVPYFKSDDLVMFETGAILIHLAMKYNKFLSTDEIKRAHTLQWMFSALNSVEPFLFHLFMLKFDPEATEGTKEKARQICRERIRILAEHLGEKEFFVESFSITDIVMTTVLKTSTLNNFLDPHPNLLNYMNRIEARPAFQRALSEHIKLYKE